MRVAFFLPNASDARYKKRINALEKNGVEATILAFKRNYYPGKPFDNDYTLLGNISHGQYYKRLIPFMRAFFKIRDAIKNTNVIYTFGLDVLSLSWLVS